MSGVKTLDEILAQMGHPVCAKTSESSTKTQATPNAKTTPAPHTKTPKTQTSHTPKRQTKPSAKTPTQPTSAVTALLSDAHQSVLDDNTLRLLSEVQIEQLPTPDRAKRYLRWLAFYYLSRRELSAYELRQKLIAKECDPTAVDALLVEFAEKGYQSDERCATMLVHEAVRKGRGTRHLHEQLKKARLDARDFGGMDALIQRADVASISDGTILEGNAGDDVDWLKLAVEARTKKYGDSTPKDPKEKARQLRFLQYRGFSMSVCFDALKMTLGDFDD